MIDLDIIQVAQGKKEPDLVLKNCNIINVFTGVVEKGDIAIHKEYIAGVGDYSSSNEIDLNGKYVSPGFVDSHVHIESSLVTIPEYAKTVVPLGTTSVIIDPHEIANVLGLDGIRFMLKSSKYNPLSVYFMLPSCVPATDMETSGAELRAFDLFPFTKEEWVKGLAEVMNFPGVLNMDMDVLDKLRLMEDKVIDGHAPGLSGKELNAYIAAGISSDHECTTANEALEKLNKGMYIMIREGTIAKNLKDLVPIINEKTYKRCLWATDDRHPDDLIREGHINYIIKKAISYGVDPITAIQIATINPAEHFNIKNSGAVAPSYFADLVVFDDFENFNILKVFKSGKLVAENGKYIFTPPVETRKINIRRSINIKWLKDEDFQIPAKSEKINVIEIIDKQLLTKRITANARINNNLVESDIDNDIIKCIVVERHFASDNIGKGFVKGFGLKRGAIASSVAHDSHNIIVIGVNDNDMIKAVTHIRKMQGGFCAVHNEEVAADLPLPIAGLMSDKSMYEVYEDLQKLNKATEKLGINIQDPFLMLSFLALPVIPELKITDKGLVDVNKFQFIDLFE